MAVFITKCPHCSADQMTFPIFGVSLELESTFRNKATSVCGNCGLCGRPVAAAINWRPVTQSRNGYDWYKVAVGHLTGAGTNLTDLGFYVSETWPKPPEVEVPPSLPDIVSRAFRQAEQNRLMPDCEEAAATMYRRALDLALKEAFPEERGTLDQKLRKLIADHRLPQAVGDWAHEVRLIGNDGAHDAAGVAESDLLDARAFIDTVLKYLFTLPAQIAARRPITISGQS